MKTFYIDLNESSSKKPRIIRLLAFGAMVCIAFILASIAVFLKYTSSFEWIFLISAIYVALYVYFAWITYKTKLYIKADVSGIDFKFGIRSNSGSYIIWDSVSKVRIGYAYIAFFKKSGRRKKIQLSWLPYSKVIEVKEKLEAFCKYKKIACEKIDFIDYSKKKDKEES